MIYFPHNPLRHATKVTQLLAAVRQAASNRDILWNRPLFKAPALPNPRIAVDPLPFTAARVTQRTR
jgi:hypothetical protein